MSRRQESWMTSSLITRLNIPATHSLNKWMGKTEIIKSWAQDPGLVSNVFTKMDKRIISIKDDN